MRSSGMPKLPFELGITHYDDPPPDVLGPARSRDGPLLPEPEGYEQRTLAVVR